jgi:DNA-binding NarL/FixJ family response regulator
LANVQGQDQHAARLLALAELQRTASGGVMFYTLVRPSDRAQAIEAVCTRLGKERFAACWAEGQAMTGEQAVALALEVVEVPAVKSPSQQDPSASVGLPGNPADLTAREMEVLQLLAQGLTYAQIADKLVISRRTVNVHLTSIYSKLDVTSRAAATRFAIDHHLV